MKWICNEIHLQFTSSPTEKLYYWFSFSFWNIDDFLMPNTHTHTNTWIEARFHTHKSNDKRNNNLIFLSTINFVLFLGMCAYCFIILAIYGIPAHKHPHNLTHRDKNPSHIYIVWECLFGKFALNKIRLFKNFRTLCYFANFHIFALP